MSVIVRVLVADFVYLVVICGKMFLGFIVGVKSCSFLERISKKLN